MTAKKITLVDDDNGYGFVYHGDTLVTEYIEVWEATLFALNLAGVSVFRPVNGAITAEECDHVFDMLTDSDGEARFTSLKALKAALAEDPEETKRNKRIAELEAELVELRKGTR